MWSNSEVVTYRAEMERRLVGACNNIITHMRFTEKIKLIQISPSLSQGVILTQNRGPRPVPDESSDWACL
jgi:hypothetical protein